METVKFRAAGLVNVADVFAADGVVALIMRGDGAFARGETSPD